ncbi:MAG: DUF5674 family protein [Patescibacteria group bacterium]
MDIHIINTAITRTQLTEIASERFGDIVKAVVDIKRGVMAIGGEMHADEEIELLAQGSVQDDLWGINLYPDKTDEGWIEFDSMINLRPSQGNRSRSVEDPTIRQTITHIVASLITD